MAARRRTPAELYQEAGVGTQHWRSRLRPAVYRSPSGTAIEFQYGDVSREFDLRTTPFGFPGVPGEYVQQNRYGSSRYPCRCLFSGTYCDLEATAFEDALREPGVGKLQHPLYGTFDVIPFGTVTRNDYLKTAANQAIVEVTFWTTLKDLYPRALQDPDNEIASAIDRFDLAAAQQFDKLASLTTALQKAQARATIQDFLRKVGGVFDQLSDTVWSVRDTMQDVEDTINLGIDQLIGKPLLLAEQISNLLKAPARAIDGIVSRLDSYADFADEIFGTSSANPSTLLEQIPAAASGRYGLTYRAQSVANNFHIADLFASSAVSAAVLSALQSTTDARAGELGIATASGRTADATGTTASPDPRVSRTFLTKSAAVSAADALVTLHDAYTVWRDAGFDALGDVDKTGLYQADLGEAAAELRSAVTLAAGHLVAVSFSLAPEKGLVLDRARTPVDLAGELYGHVDKRDGFDPVLFLIETNALTGTQRLEIPRGRRITYYERAAA
jgi:hypothetical protein